MPRPICVACAAAMSMLAAVRLGAQDIPARPLPKFDAELAEPFSSIGAIRELSDGRVIVTDAKDLVLYVGDFGKSTLTKIGRNGRGPGEYGSPFVLFAAPADTTYVFDVINRRMLVVDPGAHAGRTWMMMVNAGGGEQPLFAQSPAFADRAGNFYSRGYLNRLNRGTTDRTDSAALLRYNPAKKSVDTLAYLALPPEIVMSYNGGTSTRIHPMANVDAWAVAPDGRVAIVHSSPYQIEWVAAGGARTRGPVVTYQKVPVTAEERAAELKAEQSKQSMFNGMSAAEAGIQRTAPTYDKWPEFTPPFRSLFIRVSPEGNLWVERWRAAKDSIPTFDVFDARGVRIDRVALPPRARLIGVGAGTVYIARVDADDLQYLQRVRIR